MFLLTVLLASCQAAILQYRADFSQGFNPGAPGDDWAFWRLPATNYTANDGQYFANEHGATIMIPQYSKIAPLGFYGWANLYKGWVRLREGPIKLASGTITTILAKASATFYAPVDLRYGIFSIVYNQIDPRIANCALMISEPQANWNYRLVLGNYIIYGVEERLAYPQTLSGILPNYYGYSRTRWSLPFNTTETADFKLEYNSNEGSLRVYVNDRLEDTVSQLGVDADHLEAMEWDWMGMGRLAEFRAAIGAKRSPISLGHLEVSWGCGTDFDKATSTGQDFLSYALARLTTADIYQFPNAFLRENPTPEDINYGQGAAMILKELEIESRMGFKK